MLRLASLADPTCTFILLLAVIVDVFFFLVTNPVLYSMIAKNNMTDCHEIQDLYSKCMDTSPQQSRPIICETAHKLYVQCHVSEK